MSKEYFELSQKQILQLQQEIAELKDWKRKLEENDKYCIECFNWAKENDKLKKQVDGLKNYFNRSQEILNKYKIKDLTILEQQLANAIVPKSNVEQKIPTCEILLGWGNDKYVGKCSQCGDTTAGYMGVWEVGKPCPNCRAIIKNMRARGDME